MIVIIFAALSILIVAVLTGYVEDAEEMQDMQELLSQENVLSEDQIRNIDQNIVDEFYNNELDGSKDDNNLGFNFTIIVNDVVQ